MINKLKYIYFSILLFSSCSNISKEVGGKTEEILLTQNSANENYIQYTLNPYEHNLEFYWKDDKGVPYSNFENLNKDLILEGKELIFAMNGGMYLKDQSPQGLYIEKGIELSKLDTTQIAYGNFYMQPNGIFYLTNDNHPVVCQSSEFKTIDNIKYATQSGPMLIINGEMHPNFIEASSSLHIRNGVGILPNGEILFAMSKSEVNFYDFATLFIENGCKNALYLDGFVSRAYLPSQDWMQQDGQFGVIIGVTKDINLKE